MGRQIQIYATGRDLEDLEKEVGKGFRFLIVAYKLNGRNLEFSATLESAGENDFQTCFLVPPSMTSEVKLQHVEAQSYWTVDLLRSPAVELSKCFFDGKVLKRGRLFYDPGYFGGNGVWVEKPAEFIKWADAIFRCVRKVFPYDPQLESCVGPDALRLRNQDGVEFVSLTFKKAT